MTAPRRYTLITSGNISTTPRLVKAADALTRAGHVVRVVAVDVLAVHARGDAAILATRSWVVTRVALAHGTLGGAVRRAWHGAWHVAARLAWRTGLRSDRIADHAVSRYLAPLLRAARRAPADVVIGHTLGALPVATRAARAVGAAAGFDSEDLHSEELSPIPAHGAARSLVAAVERRHLPACTYVTASAEGIARAMAERYGIGRPTVILNTFPLADRPIVPRSGREHGRGGGGPSLYWYSQVIGAGRGLDDALEALGHLDERIVLHLRGTLDPAFARVLRRRVAALGIGHRVHLLPLVPPPALVAAAAEHDIGLALERAQPMNRDLCVSNKLCTYLVAGLAVVATDTHGQRAILADAPDAGLLYPPGDARALAAAVRALVDAPGALDRAKLASRAAADRRYAWDYDAPRLVAYL